MFDRLYSLGYRPSTTQQRAPRLIPPTDPANRPNAMTDVLYFPTCQSLAVYPADAARPPLMPVGSFALEIRDANDVVLAYAVVHPSALDKETITGRAYDLKEMIEQRRAICRLRDVGA